MMGQYSQPIDVTEIEKFVEPEVLEVVKLPSQNGIVDTEEISVEVSFATDKLREWQERQSRNAALFGESFIFDVKEKEIKLAVIRLYGLVYRRFVEEAKVLGRTLKPDNVKQVIEIPVSYIDLYPGSTAIHFKVFTKRKLVVAEVKDGDGVH